MAFCPSRYSTPLAGASLGASAEVVSAGIKPKAPWLTEERAGALATITSAAVGAGVQIGGAVRRRRRGRRRRAQPAVSAIPMALPPPTAPPWGLILGTALILGLGGAYVALKRKGKLQ